MLNRTQSQKKCRASLHGVVQYPKRHASAKSRLTKAVQGVGKRARPTSLHLDLVALVRVRVENGTLRSESRTTGTTLPAICSQVRHHEKRYQYTCSLSIRLHRRASHLEKGSGARDSAREQQEGRRPR